VLLKEVVDNPRSRLKSRAGQRDHGSVTRPRNTSMRLARTVLYMADNDRIPPAPAVERANPDKVRRGLARLLAEAKSARSSPWDRARMRLYSTIFPRMTLGLPDEEAAQYRLDFEAEMLRLA
jgi:hypothetical protein